jgi:hypothetical protein
MMIRYITQMIFCALVFVMSTNYSYGQPGEDIAVTPKDQEINDELGPNCLKLNITPSNYGVLNIDCPEETIFQVDILKNTCGCENYEVAIGGSLIKTLNKNELASFFIAKSEAWAIGEIFGNETPGKHLLSITVRCLKDVSNGTGGTSFYTTSTQSVEIQLVKGGQEYTAEIKHSVHQPIGQFKPTEVLNELSVCCNPDKILKISNATSKIVGSSVASTINIEGSFEISSGPVTMKFPISTSQIYSNYESNEIIEITESSTTIDGSKNPNGCQQLGYLLKGDIFTYQKFKAICYLPDVAIGEPWVVNVPQYAELKVFKVDPDPAANCPPVDPFVDPKRNFFNRMACTGSLVLEVENQEDLYISWTNEDGEVMESPDGNLSGVPLGQYTVTISNQCCEVVTKTYYLCESTTESSYSQSFNDQWCRTVTCYGEGCNEVYTECVTPDRIEDKFDQNQKKCIREYYYNNEILGTTSVDATFETEWDDVWDRCKTSYFCNGSVVFTEDNYPDQSEWVYSSSENQCQRNVMCDGSWIYNVENSTPYEEWVMSGDQCQLNVTCNGIITYGVEYIYPDVTWSFDDVANNCYSTRIYCDGNYTSGYLTNAPSFGPWQLANPWCYRDVICPGSSGSHNDNGPFTYLDMGTSATCNGNNRLWNRYCDGELIDQICAESAWGVNGNSTESRGKFNANFRINANFIHIDITQVDSELYMYLHDVNGKLVGKQFIEKNQNSIMLETQEFPSGIYFIVLTDGKKIIESSKFSIVK